ncbi:uncharacterized protein LOC127241429 isoform X2 [Andrographis paniculata]|uniref:uncharacterized protein LOC127241429 isoform X2 n=1 Tax=Andrographis paniculata TaxID=175694 RepID=UPI0021E91218|nr:uncharacterized protein LOC127241429 isoform X2 [Andrographis paniculata]
MPAPLATGNLCHLPCGLVVHIYTIALLCIADMPFVLSVRPISASVVWRSRRLISRPTVPKSQPKLPVKELVLSIRKGYSLSTVAPVAESTLSPPHFQVSYEELTLKEGIKSA